MTPVTWTRDALDDLDRLDGFLRKKKPRAADAAVDAIFDAVNELRLFPELGRQVPGPDDFHREWIVHYSNSGYVVLYFFERVEVEILRVKHQSEGDYA